MGINPLFEKYYQKGSFYVIIGDKIITKDEDLTNAFNEFFSKIEKQLGIFETSADQINTSNIQEPISTTIDKYKKHSSILKTKKML